MERILNSNNYTDWMERGELHIKYDPSTQLHAIIAIYDTHLGPALGGCRFIEYESLNHAFYDALRLGKAMAYKAAAANLPLGGGKSVILKPKNLTNRQALFESFGAFVETLNGHYITALDSGTTIEDMGAIATKTAHCSSKPSDGSPSPFTANGIQRGIEAAVKFKLGADNLNGLHIAIRGVGGVGYNLASGLHAAGAKLTVADINSEAVKKCADEFGAEIGNVDAIHSIKCDVFAPCALGGGLNQKSIPELNTPIVAGGANNQLARDKDADLLTSKGILYAPDFVINAGGLIHCLSCVNQQEAKHKQKRIDSIYDSLMQIFQRAKQEKLNTVCIANKIAEERMQA